MFNIEETQEYVRRISKAVQMPIALPRGRKFASCQEYLSRFSDEQLTIFFGKLATSKWVKSNYFSLDKMVSEDIVNTLLAGGVREKEAVNRYYNPKTLYIVKK